MSVTFDGWGYMRLAATTVDWLAAAKPTGLGYDDDPLTIYMLVALADWRPSADDAGLLSSFETSHNNFIFRANSGSGGGTGRALGFWDDDDGVVSSNTHSWGAGSWWWLKCERDLTADTVQWWWSEADGWTALPDVASITWTSLGSASITNAAKSDTSAGLKIGTRGDGGDDGTERRVAVVMVEGAGTRRVALDMRDDAQLSSTPPNYGTWVDADGNTWTLNSSAAGGWTGNTKARPVVYGTAGEGSPIYISSGGIGDLAVSSLTQPLTRPDGDDLMLLVFLLGHETGDTHWRASTVKFGGRDLTKVTNASCTDSTVYQYAEAWYLKHDDVLASGNLVATFPGAVDEAHMVWVWLRNVAQGAPETSDTSTNCATAGSLTMNLTTVSDDALVVTGYSSSSKGSVGWTGTDTPEERFEWGRNTSTASLSTMETDTAGAKTVTADPAATTVRHAGLAVALAGASTVPVDPNANAERGGPSVLDRAAWYWHPDDATDPWEPLLGRGDLTGTGPQLVTKDPRHASFWTPGTAASSTADNLTLDPIPAWSDPWTRIGMYADVALDWHSAASNQPIMQVWTAGELVRMANGKLRVYWYDWDANWVSADVLTVTDLVDADYERIQLMANVEWRSGSQDYEAIGYWRFDDSEAWNVGTPVVVAKAGTNGWFDQNGSAKITLYDGAGNAAGHYHRLTVWTDSSAAVGVLATRADLDLRDADDDADLATGWADEINGTWKLKDPSSGGKRGCLVTRSFWAFDLGDRFDAAVDTLGDFPTTSFTALVLYRAYEVSNQYFHVGKRGGGASQEGWSVYVQDPDVDTVGVYADVHDGTTQATASSGSGSTAWDEWRTAAVRVDRVAQTIESLAQGSTYKSALGDASAVGAVSAGTMQVAALQSTTYRLGGHIGALVLFDEALTDDELDEVHQRLLGTWEADYPELAVEVAWQADPFEPTPAWTDLTGRLVEAKVRRGRQYELDRIEAGTLTLLLRNDDRALEPRRVASPYYPHILPRKQVRLRAADPDRPWLPSAHLYRGFIQAIDLDYRMGETAVAVVDCVDALAMLAVARKVEPYHDAVLDDGPVGYWRMNESGGTTVTDWSGNAHHGTLVGSSTRQGEPGPHPDATAYEFVADVTGYVEVADHADLRIDGALTLETWLYVYEENPAGGTSGSIPINMGRVHASSDEDFYALQYNHLTRGLHLLWRDNDVFVIVRFSAATSNITPRRWHHVAFTRDDDPQRPLVRLWVDGEHRGYGTLRGWRIKDPGSPADAKLLMGKQADLTADDTHKFAGRLAGVAVFDKVLDPARIAAHAEAGGGTGGGGPSEYLPATSAAERVEDLLDLAGWPTELRDVVTPDSGGETETQTARRQQTSSIQWTAAATTLRWTHVIGHGPNRMLVLVVAHEDGDKSVSTLKIDGTQVGVGYAAASGTGTGSTRVTLVYVLDADLPAPGPHEIEVTMSGSVAGGMAAVVSLAGVAQQIKAVNAYSTTATGIETGSGSITVAAGAISVGVAHSTGGGAHTLTPSAGGTLERLFDAANPSPSRQRAAGYVVEWPDGGANLTIDHDSADNVLRSAGTVWVEPAVAVADLELVGDQVQPLDLSEPRDVLQALQETARSEQGLLYATADGCIRFESRLWRTRKRPEPAVVFGDDPTADECGYSEVELVYDFELIWTAVEATREADGTVPGDDPLPQQARDGDAETQFGPRRLALNNLTVASDAQAAAVARALLNAYKRPRLTFRTVGVIGAADRWGAILGRDISDRVRIRRRPGHKQGATLPSDPVDRVAHIERIEHRIRAAERTWETTLTVSDASLTAFGLVGSDAAGVVGETTRLRW